MICRFCPLTSCFGLSVVMLVASAVLDILYEMSALLPIFSYSSITELLCTCKLFKITFRFIKNNLEQSFTICYFIINPRAHFSMKLITYFAIWVFLIIKQKWLVTLVNKNLLYGFLILFYWWIPTIEIRGYSWLYSLLY